MSEGEGKPGIDRTAEPGDGRAGFLGFAAHEIRNPLSTALWSAELLARLSAEERGGARGEKLTAMCLRSLGRVRQLVEDHLLCERLDAGGLPQRSEPIELRALVEEVLSRRAADAPPARNGVPAELVVKVDRGLLERAIDSLVAAAGREAREVRVDARSGPDATTLVVMGGPPGPDGLRDPRKGSPGDPKGRALSVPVARRVAVALGGALELEGDAFVFSLPRAAAYTPRPDPSAHP